MFRRDDADQGVKVGFHLLHPLPGIGYVSPGLRHMGRDLFSQRAQSLGELIVAYLDSLGKSAQTAAVHFGNFEEPLAGFLVAEGQTGGGLQQMDDRM